MRSTAIALIAMVMPLGLDISGDGDVSFGAPLAHAQGGGGEGGGGEGGGGSGGGGGGGDGSGGGGGAGGGGAGGSGGGGSGGGGSGDGGSGDGGSGASGSGDGGSGAATLGVGQGTGSTPGAPGSSAPPAVVWFNGSAEPAGPDLTENEELSLIARGWQ